MFDRRETERIGVTTRSRNTARSGNVFGGREPRQKRVAIRT